MRHAPANRVVAAATAFRSGPLPDHFCSRCCNAKFGYLRRRPTPSQDGRTDEAPRRSFVLLCHCCCGSGTAFARPSGLSPGVFSGLARIQRNLSLESQPPCALPSKRRWRRYRSSGACFCVLIASSVMQKGYKECATAS